MSVLNTEVITARVGVQRKGVDWDKEPLRDWDWRLGQGRETGTGKCREDRDQFCKETGIMGGWTKSVGVQRRPGLAGQGD